MHRSRIAVACNVQQTELVNFPLVCFCITSDLSKIAERTRVAALVVRAIESLLRIASYTAVWFDFRVSEVGHAPASQAGALFTYLEFNAKNKNSMLKPRKVATNTHRS